MNKPELGNNLNKYLVWNKVMIMSNLLSWCYEEDCEVEKKRIFWIDLGKGITIFLVVLAHSINNTLLMTTHNMAITPQEKAILNFMNYALFLVIMPVFFALSGFLYKPTIDFKSFKNRIIKKVISLLGPYIFFSLLFIVLSIITDSVVQGADGILSLLDMLYAPFGYLWYLYVLFFIFIIVDVMYILSVPELFQFLLYFVLCVIGMTIDEDSISKILTWLFFFYLGYLLRQRAYIFSISSKKYIFIIILFIASAIVPIIFQKDWIVNSNQVHIENLIAKILSIFIFFKLFNILNTKSKLAQYFIKSGKQSLIIYLVHVPIILILGKFYFGSWEATLTLYLLVSWICSKIIANLSSEINILEFIFYPNKYI